MKMKMESVLRPKTTGSSPKIWTAVLLAMAGIFLGATSAGAATVTSAGSGNWNSTTPNAPWPGGTLPAASSDVVIFGGHSVTVTVAVTGYPGSVTINSGGLLDIRHSLTNNGTTTVNGTLRHSLTTGTKNHIGEVIINSGGLWEETVAEDIAFGGNFQNDGTLTASTGIHTFTGTGKTLGGTNTIANVTISGTYANTGVLTVSTALAGAGTLTQGANAVLNLGGTVINPLVATADGNTVNYTKSGVQAVKPTPYYYLTLSGSGAKTTATVTVNGVLSMEGTATATVAVTYGATAVLQYNTAAARTAGPEWNTPFGALGGVIITNTGTITLNSDKVFSESIPLAIRSSATLNSSNYNLTVGGTFVNSGSFVAGLGTVEWNAAGSQSVPTGTYYNVIFSGSGAKAIGAGTTIAGDLSIAPSGSATANIGAGQNIGVGTLTLGGALQSRGTWGSSSASLATHQNNVYFDATTGYLTVLRDGTTVTWRGTGDWFADVGNWSNGIPGTGSNVWIGSGIVTLTNATPQLLEFNIGTLYTTGTVTLVFTNWATRLTASNMTVRSGATLTCTGPFADTAGLSNRVWIICTNLLVETNGLIDVNGKGYLGGGQGLDGKGPGKGLKVSSNNDKAGGGGHGGWGGSGGGAGLGGAPYDSTNRPAIPGSGGGGSSWSTGSGGAGGGAVWIEAAGDVTLYGTLRANGVNSSEGGVYIGGAGSGGAIYIGCATLKGSTNGLISADGGNAILGGSGGGGRIGMQYNGAAQQSAGSPGVRVSANAGTGTSPLSAPPTYARSSWGTIWMPDNILLSAQPMQFQNIGIANPTNWSVNSLSITGMTLGFLGGGLITISNDLSVDAGGILACWEGSSLDVRGNLILTNGGQMSVYSAASNASARYGAVIGVTGDVTVATGSRINLYSEPSNGGSPILRVRNLAVAANASIDAAGKGFASQFYSSHGYGPGFGKSANPSTIGAGYGGIGKNSDATYGKVYGSGNAPIHPGSGGGGDFGSYGGRGGGLIRIEARENVRVDGTLAANSPWATGTGSGGSGGGIFIFCNEFLGDATGVLTVDGGPRGSSGSTAGGGGGRIAVGIGLSAQQRSDLMAGTPIEGLQTNDWYAPYAGSATATGGTNTTGASGSNGTVRFLSLPVANSYSLTVAGSPGEYDSPSPDTYNTYLNIPANTTKTNAVTTPANESSTQRWVLVRWNLKNSQTGATVAEDTTTQAVFQVTTNLTLTWYWTNQYRLTVLAGANGSVNSGSVDGWYTDGVSVSGIEATPSGGYAFAEWQGDVSAGQKTNNPLTLTLDRARTVTAVFQSTSGEAKTWTGTGLWESSTNWAPVGMPGVLDDVLIQSGTAILSTQRQVRTLMVTNGATLLFTNWITSLTASDVVVRAGGTITCAGPFNDTTDPTNRVRIYCTNLLVETNGFINANGRGFKGGGQSVSGKGPGKGLCYGSGGTDRGGGAGHGGYGGFGSHAYATGGDVYDSSNQPSLPGSGGAGTGQASPVGGSGGGAIWIEAAREVTLYGTISALGSNTTETASYSGGGGAGGAIYIGCETLKGSTNGLISVNGGGSIYGGGLGAGGRIGLSYNATAQQQAGNPGVRFSASAGTGATTFYASPGYGRSGSGTLWLPDATLLSTNWSQFANTAILNPANWSVNSMELTGLMVSFQGAGLITVSNDITIGSGGSLALGEGRSLECGGNLNLVNGGQMYVFAGVTNNAVSQGVVISVTGDVTLAAGSWIYPHSDPTNGGSPLFRVRNLTVATNAGFDASGKGFGSAYHMSNGYGPGKGQGGSPAPIGAGYGGTGAGANATYGKTYGSSNTPAHAGSGGGSDFAGFGGRGGGLIRIEAQQTVQIDGTLAANSPMPTLSSGSGGSGGGIFVLCSEFLGESTGVLTVDGGSRGSTGSTAAGGGGRIAIAINLSDAQRTNLLAGTLPEKVQIQSTYDRFNGQVTALGGTYNNSPSGSNGTIIWIWRERPTGTIFTIR